MTRIRRFQLHLVYPAQDSSEKPSVYPTELPLSTARRTLSRDKNRRFGKMVARARRELRKELVHAAGCTYRYAPAVCATRLLDADDLDNGFRVSVPRSLRGRLGRWTGSEERRG